MNDLNLRDMAIEILRIDQNFYHNMNSTVINQGIRQSDYELYTFVQMWGNTSGGFERVGGSAMTNQRTYVFVPMHTVDDRCFVYFGGTFAYSVPYSKEFMEDVIARNVKGKSQYSKYLKAGNN